MSYTFERICAWCKSSLGAGTSSTPMAGPSHGICQECAKGLLAEAGLKRHCPGHPVSVEGLLGLCTGCGRVYPLRGDVGGRT